jgi:hypothetical protein
MAYATVLALEVVTHRHVDPRELDRALAANDRSEQSHHRGHLDGDGDGSNVLVVLLDDLDLAIEDHADSALPTDDSMGLIALV